MCISAKIIAAAYMHRSLGTAGSVGLILNRSLTEIGALTFMEQVGQ